MGGETRAERLKREFQMLREHPHPYCTMGPKRLPQGGRSENELVGIVIGPKDTPYLGGQFKVEITIPPDYPKKPPQIHMKTPIYHMNIHPSNGHVCNQMFQDRGWKPTYGIRDCVNMVVSMFVTPEPTDPWRQDLANQYMRNKSEYESMCRQWTAQH